MNDPLQQLNQVETLLRNAQLRDEIEPFLDDAMLLLDTSHMTTDSENDYLESMLAWERAPMVPICQWFDPPLQLPHPSQLDDQQLRARLQQLLDRLSEKQILLQCTDHLSDRQLYTLVLRDILPVYEKQLDLPDRHLVWQCIDPELDRDEWLTYYADDQERDVWSELTGRPAPERRPLPFPRALPGASR